MFGMGVSYPFIPNSVQLFQGRRVENASANRKARQPISFPIGPKTQMVAMFAFVKNVAEYESKLRSGLANRRPGWPSLFSECVNNLSITFLTEERKNRLAYKLYSTHLKTERYLYEYSSYTKHVIDNEAIRQYMT